MRVDLVVRHGTIVDGTGQEPFAGDVAIDNGLIVDVGKISAVGREEIDARGRIVTPGFIDVHTHYDGNLTWEERIRPSCNHGVTTIITGNCGVGFAPCRTEDRNRLIGLMAGVEDIPEIVMAEGLPWTWRSFPEFLDVVASKPRDIDVAVLLPHSALRLYVMGKRAVDREAATPDDIEMMAAITREAMAAGAIGFATSRALQQRSIDGQPIPTVRAAEDELTAIAMALRDENKGVLQLLSDFGLYKDVEGEFDMFRRLVGKSGRPLSYTLHQRNTDPEGWRVLLDLTAKARADGLPIMAQVAAHPSGVLLGFELSMTPFLGCPTLESLVSLAYPARVAELRKPEIRNSILEEFKRQPTGQAAIMAPVVRDFERMFVLGDPPDYEPPLETSIASIARRLGVTAPELAYDAMLKNEGRAVLFQAAQDYTYGNLEVLREMIESENTIMGLGDGGAHCGVICDASWPTYMLAHWARDRSAGKKMSLTSVVKMQTWDAARSVGLLDRGMVRTGYKADLNVIDFDRLRLRMPRAVYDLPAGGRRLLQDAEGYVATIVSGNIIYHDDGVATHILPGKLVRGPRAAVN